MYEIDSGSVLRFKESVIESAHLKPRGVRRPVTADLRGHWVERLAGAGFDPCSPPCGSSRGYSCTSRPRIVIACSIR
ncbi:class I SAM-dependent methyltransferase [Streptomyces sp. NPDC055722]